MEKSTLLELKDFKLLDRGTLRPLTESIDLKVQSGTVYLLKGPNGIGKSSLIRALAMESRDDTRRRGHGLGHLNKTSGLEVVVHPQISAPMFALPLRLSDILSWTNQLSPAAQQLVGDLNLERSWDSCSGGERQRVLLAALFSNALSQSRAPTLLLLDEPLNHLDEISQKQVISVLRDWIAGGAKRAAIIVSHEEIVGLTCESFTLRAAPLGATTRSSASAGLP